MEQGLQLLRVGHREGRSVNAHDPVATPELDPTRLRRHALAGLSQQFTEDLDRKPLAGFTVRRSRESEVPELPDMSAARVAM